MFASVFLIVAIILVVPMLEFGFGTIFELVLLYLHEEMYTREIYVTNILNFCVHFLINCGKIEKELFEFTENIGGSYEYISTYRKKDAFFNHLFYGRITVFRKRKCAGKEQKGYVEQNDGYCI